MILILDLWATFIKIIQFSAYLFPCSLKFINLLSQPLFVHFSLLLSASVREPYPSQLQLEIDQDFFTLIIKVVHVRFEAFNEQTRVHGLMSDVAFKVALHKGSGLIPFLVS
jgi:hypothetical protein